eukprot:CAMPEP_0203760642 /NCGR_PEP_ID=MMETSP0098-20131031/13894_1 /ASSEMBLY_ACC=CAM_ASM_000208 /TAXON_ID=96639 /ORGANISM=" , Strain NY0313808BC1" /LENGTH=358 /DNA_ID=CAMNT_0050654301 /DNA_START=467 /DNA_END=1540 /DNA_ORIENTATION=+
MKTTTITSLACLAMIPCLSRSRCVNVTVEEGVFWPTSLHKPEVNLNSICAKQNLTWNLRSTSIASKAQSTWLKTFECCEDKDIKKPENEHECKWTSNARTPSFSNYSSRSYVSRSDWLTEGGDSDSMVIGCAKDGVEACPENFYNFDGIQSTSSKPYQLAGEAHYRSGFDYCPTKGYKMHYCCPIQTIQNATCTVRADSNARVDCFDPRVPPVVVQRQGKVVLYNYTYVDPYFGVKGVIIVLTYEQGLVQTMEVQHNGQPTFKVDPSSSTDPERACDRKSLVPRLLSSSVAHDYPQTSYWTWPGKGPVSIRLDWECVETAKGHQYLSIRLQKLDENFASLPPMYENEKQTYTGACTCN